MSGIINLTEKEFNSLSIKASEMYKSPIEKYMLRRAVEVTEVMLTKHNRLFAFRTDLRFASEYCIDDTDSPFLFQRTDSKVITRFLDSLKAQIKADHKRVGRKGEPALPAYVWTKERNQSEHFHYHVMLIFNREVYGYMGDFTKTDANNMSNRIQKAWCSAVGIDYPDYSRLVHFPDKSYRFDRHDAIQRNKEYMHYLFRLAYLTKSNTKDNYDIYRNFGTSQT